MKDTSHGGKEERDRSRSPRQGQETGQETGKLDCGGGGACGYLCIVAAVS